MIDFKVSVITPAYNAQEFIRRTIVAAVSQEEVGEIIIVEDCSPDDTLKVCEELQREFPKVRLLQHPDKKNHGAGASRNLGILNARYDFIAFADADNHYLPGRFKLDKEILMNNPEIDGVYHCEGNYYYSEKAKKTFYDAGFGYQEFLRLSAPVPPEELVYVLMHTHPTASGEFGTDAITVRKSVFDKVGLFEPSLRLQQDIHLWFRLAAKCKLVAGQLDNPVALRGVHEKQRMVNVEAQKKYGNLRMEMLYKWVSKEITDRNIVENFKFSFFNHKVKSGSKLLGVWYFTRYILTHLGLIKLPNGFFDLNFFHLFGRNWLTLHSLSAKNRIFN